MFVYVCVYVCVCVCVACCLDVRKRPSNIHVTIFSASNSNLLSLSKSIPAVRFARHEAGSLKQFVFISSEHKNSKFTARQLHF